MGVNSLEGVGVTDDSLELSELETMTEGSVRDSKEPMGEGPGIDSVTDNSVLDRGTVEGLGTGLPSTSSGNSLEGNDGLYVDDGNGISSGRRSSYWYASSSSPSGTEEGIVGISEGAAMLSSSACRLSLHLHSAV